MSKGLFKRGEIWWYRIGRKIRRSARTRNVEEAAAMRATALAEFQRQYVNDEWQSLARQQRADSNSWLRRAHSHMRRKSSIRQWPECISLTELTQVMLNSQGRCAITGLPFDCNPAAGRSPFAISVDRIDSSQGYCVGNVRLVLLAVNLAMSHWGEEAFRAIARATTGSELLNVPHTTLHTTFRPKKNAK